MKIVGRVAIGPISDGSPLPHRFRRDAHRKIITTYIKWDDYPQVTARARRPQTLFTAGSDAPAVDAALLLPRAMIDLSIRDAIVSYRAGQPSPESRDAMNWLTSRSSHPMSFNWCCEWLGIETEHYRKAVLAKVWHVRNIDHSRNIIARSQGQEPSRSRYFPQSYGRQSRQPRRLLDGI